MLYLQGRLVLSTKVLSALQANILCLRTLWRHLTARSDDQRQHYKRVAGRGNRTSRMANVQKFVAQEGQPIKDLIMMSLLPQRFGDSLLLGQRWRNRQSPCSY